MQLFTRANYRKNLFLP